MAKSKSELADSLAIELADSLNKKFKNTGYQTAFFLDGDTKAPSEVKGWVETGSSMLDLAISNREEGGFPVGRITEITGLEDIKLPIKEADSLSKELSKSATEPFSLL